MKKLNTAILTATPDLIAQKLFINLIERLKLNNIYPIAIIPKVFSNAESFMLYNGVQTHPRTNESRLHSNWLSPQLFTGGISFILFLNTHDKVDLQEKLRDLKGGSRLNEKNIDRLRGISNLCDRSHSLVHSPDNQAGLHHEIELLFGNSFQNYLSDKKITDDLIKILFSTNSHSTLEVLPLLIQKAYCLFLMDPECIVDEKNLLLLIQKLSGILDYLSQPFTSTTIDSFWELLSLLHNDTNKIFKQLKDSSVPENLKSFNRHLARLNLARVIAESCSKFLFTPIVSGLLIKSFNNIDFPLNHWEQQQLHIIAAYHK